MAVVDGDGKLVWKLPLPIRTTSIGNRTDPRGLDFQILCLRDDCESMMVALEDPGGHAPSAAGLRSMTHSFATIETLLIVREIPYTTVSARVWQGSYWTPKKAVKPKDAALDTATKKWPCARWLASARSRKPHDGMIDAALIADWARRSLL
jgi:hypothetical protein